MTALEERAENARRSEDLNSDLGFGAVVASETRQRLLNRDGSFNVRRDGLRFWQSLSAYHSLLTMSWSKFLSYFILLYVVANALFGFIYFSLGEDALTGDPGGSGVERYLKAFFFSVHTLATIGYGNVAPNSLSADIVVTIEALISLFALAVIAGLVFARFARPVACIVFSNHAVIAPYRGGRAFMFRIVNKRNNQIVDLQVRVLLTRRKPDGAGREFVSLRLERDHVAFFPLAWTIVHPIENDSPLRGWTEEDLRTSGAEFLILLNGFDETFSQTVHTRSSYVAGEVVWGARFRSMFNAPGDEGLISVDIRRLDELEPVEV